MMRSATAFLPDSMMTFMNLERSTEPNLGSGRMSRLGTSRRRGISHFLWFQLAPAFTCASGGHQDRPLTRRLQRAATKSTPGTRPGAGRTRTPRRERPGEGRSGLLGALGAVLRARLLAILDALQIERAAHDVVSHARQILDAAAAHEHHAVLLQVVALATDVGNDLEPVRQTHLGDLAQRRVRLLRRRRVDAGADAAPLRAALQRRRLRLDGLGLAAMADELVDRGHKDSIRCEPQAPGQTPRIRTDDLAPRPNWSDGRKADDCMSRREDPQPAPWHGVES